MDADLCPSCDPGLRRDATDLAARLDNEQWIVAALAALERSGLPEAWIGAGVLRDVVWGYRQPVAVDSRAPTQLDLQRRRRLLARPTTRSAPESDVLMGRITPPRGSGAVLSVSASYPA